MKALCTIYVGICGIYSEKVRNTYFYNKVNSCAHPTSFPLAMWSFKYLGSSEFLI